VLRWSALQNELTRLQLLVVPLALFLIFICGVLEDTVGLATITRFLLQGAAALLVIQVNWSFGAVYLPIVGNVELGVFTVLVSLVWIVGVTNAVNLLDGLDGLAGGVVAIISTTLLVLSIWRQDFVTVLVMGAVFGACMGFLRHNWAPARIYLGDAGSLTFGFLLAIVALHSSIKAPATIAILVPVLALGLPVIDTLLVMLFRFTQRRRGSLATRFGRMFRADRKHLHHLLVSLGPSRKKIVVAIYVVAASFCGLALIVAAARSTTLGFFLIVIEVLIVFGMRQLGMHADALRISLEKRTSVRDFLLSSVRRSRSATDNPGELEKSA
jgi:UDP-GlcNAc:undecaprenyl-phosphate GlcNAc-1-phosphate transferase